MTVTDEPTKTRYVYQASSGESVCEVVTFTHWLAGATPQQYVEEMFIEGKIEVGLYIVVDVDRDKDNWSFEHPGGVIVYRIFVV